MLLGEEPRNASGPRDGARNLIGLSAGSGKAESAALLAPTHRQVRPLDQLCRGEPGRLMPVEDRGGDVGVEIGEPKKLAEVGSVKLLALRQIAELAAFVFDQHVMEAVGGGAQPDQCPIG